MQPPEGRIAMLVAGLNLRGLRERLGLTMREVESASFRIAERHGNDEFAVCPSRLSDIETKGLVPSIFRLYSLSVIYRCDLREILAWYGIDLSLSAADLHLSLPPKSAKYVDSRDTHATGSLVRSSSQHQSEPHGRAVGIGAAGAPGEPKQ
jgi:transcriptional regulator with XRE-family HTH domain